MSRLPSDEVRRIGFNDTVEVSRRTFHVQTEVLVLDAITIRTTVLEAGVVKLAQTRPCPEDATELEAFRALVRGQHQHFVAELSRMGAPWPASI